MSGFTDTKGGDLTPRKVPSTQNASQRGSFETNTSQEIPCPFEFGIYEGLLENQTPLPNNFLMVEAQTRERRNADIDPAVARRVSTSSPTVKRAVRKSVYIPTPHSEILNVDWEAMVKGVFSYPNNHLEVLFLKKQNRGFEEDEIIKAQNMQVVEPYIKECLRVISHDSRTIRHRYANFGNKFKQQAEMELTPMISSPKQSRNDYFQSTTGPLDEGMLNIEKAGKPQGEFGKAIRGDLKYQEQELFAQFPSQDKEMMHIPIIPSVASMIERMPETMILLNEFSLDTVKEPLFFNFSLHNAKTRERISEDYNCVSDESMKCIELEQRRVRPLFYVNTPNTNDLKDIILFVKISRLLRSSSEATDVDILTTVSKKDADGFKLAVDELVNPRSSKGQPLVQIFWGVLSLFDETGKIGGSVVNPMSAGASSPTKGYENSRKFQMELRLIKPGTTVTNDQAYDFQPYDTVRKSKVFPQKLTIEVKTLKTEPKGKRLNSSRNPIKEDTTTSDDAELVQEVGFFEEKSDPWPHTTFYNDLYVYPESVALRLPSEATIQLKVELRVDEFSGENSTSKNFYWPYSRGFHSYHLTSAVSSGRVFTFNEEIKIKLPMVMTNKMHLFFTYYNCTTKKGTKVYTVIGHSFLPLYEGQKMVNDEKHMIPVSKGELTGSYLAEGTAKMSKEKKLVVKTRLNSSIYTNDPVLNRFFLECYKSGGNDSNNVSWGDVTDHVIIGHLPLGHVDNQE